MNIASLIRRFATAPSYTVKRTTRAPKVRGRVVLPAPTEFAIVASVSPASGKDLQRVPEGHTDSETRTVITATELYAGGQGADYEADKVVIDGDDWEVTHVERWVDSRSRNSGWKAVVIRE